MMWPMLLFVLLASVLMPNAHTFRSSLPLNTRSNSNFYMATNDNIITSRSDWTGIKSRIQDYLVARKDMNLPPFELDNSKGDIRVTNRNNNNQVKEGNPLEMFKPTGWYKDLAAIDLKARSDSKIPVLLHPLSYLELKRHGYEELIETIMDLGGPFEVGKVLGIEYIEPIIEKREEDEIFRPVRQETFALDMRGSLLLGGALDDKLEAAANIDMNSLKLKIAEKNNGENNFMDAMKSSSNRGSGDDIDYSNIKKTPLKKKWVAPKIDPVQKSERFALDTLQRGYLLATIFSFAVGFGRASGDMIERGYGGDLFVSIHDASSSVTLGMFIATIASTLLVIKNAQEKGRNIFVWAAKSILAGPFVLQEIKGLEGIDKSPK